MQALASALRSKLVLAVVAAVVVGSGAYAFAATLGVTSSSLGAGNAAVTSCMASIGSTYTTAYDSSVTGDYRVDTVALTIPTGTTCVAGDTLDVTLQGASGAQLATIPYTLKSTDIPSSSATTVTFTSGTSPFDGTGVPVSAQSLQGIAVAAVGQ